MIWTRENIGNYAPHITMIGRTYYRVLRGTGMKWIVQTGTDRKEWTTISEHRTQRDAKAWVCQQAA